MKTRSPKLPRNWQDFRRLIQYLRAFVLKVIGILEELDYTLDNWVQELGDGVGRPLPTNLFSTPPPSGQHWATLSNEIKTYLKLVAGKGVDSLGFRPRAKGFAEVRIGNSDHFLLPPLLSDLLAILASEDEGLDDGFVNWKSLKDIAERLEKKHLRKFSPHGISQLLSRLRTVLWERGKINPFLLQRKKDSFRFALRSKRALPVGTKAV